MDVVGYWLSGVFSTSTFHFSTPFNPTYGTTADISEGKGRLETWKASFRNLVTFQASIYASKKGFCIRSEDYLVLDKLSDFFVF